MQVRIFTLSGYPVLLLEDYSMTQRSFTYGIRSTVVGTAVVIVLGFTMANWRTIDAIVLAQQSGQGDKSVEQVRRNIQVLKGLPDSQLLPVMHLMRTSLGVRCDYCHIAENGKYWMDDKPAKQIARQHIQMTFDLNKTNFNGKTVITCNTCHQGQVKPVSIPLIGQGAFTDTTRADAGETKSPEPLPTVDEVFNKYFQAIGSRAAVDKIKTRMTKLSLLRPRLINPDTPKAAMINRGETWTVETFQKGPDKYWR